MSMNSVSLSGSLLITRYFRCEHGLVLTNVHVVKQIMSDSSGSRSHITFLVGKPMARDSMIAGVIERAHHHWSTVTLHRPESNTPLPESIHQSDLIVQRGLNREQLNAISHLEKSGVRFINRISAAVDCADRWTLMSKLHAGGVPVPKTRLIESWTEVLNVAKGNATVIKTLDGALGRSAHVLMAQNGLLPSIEPFAGPFIVQDYVPGNPTVSKVYVAGKKMRGLEKKSLVAEDLDDDFVVPFEVGNELQDISKLVAKVLSLDIFGVDYLEGPMGPTVIDVNPFPGFRGIPDASRIISRHVLDVFQKEIAGG